MARGDRGHRVTAAQEAEKARTHDRMRERGKSGAIMRRVGSHRADRRRLHRNGEKTVKYY